MPRYAVPDVMVEPRVPHVASPAVEGTVQFAALVHAEPCTRLLHLLVTPRYALRCLAIGRLPVRLALTRTSLLLVLLALLQSPFTLGGALAPALLLHAALLRPVALRVPLALRISPLLQRPFAVVPAFFCRPVPIDPFPVDPASALGTSRLIGAAMRAFPCWGAAFDRSVLLPALGCGPPFRVTRAPLHVSGPA